MSNSTDDPFERLVGAIRMVEAGKYDNGLLHDLKEREDEVGQLACMLDVMAQQVASRERQLWMLRKVIPVGVSLSAEKNFDRLLETVVVEAQTLTNADGGTLYLLEDEKSLKFVIVRNTSLDITMGGTSSNRISFQPVTLYNEDGSENHHNVASHVALTGERVNFPDAYEVEGFDFSGTKSFDASTGYRSKSFLTVPLKSLDGKVIGVLQLINAQDIQTGEIIPFGEEDVLESLILLATAALDGYIREEQLRQEIAKLRIEINESRRARQVSDITDTNYFKNLQEMARKLREKNGID